ncbi:B- and T-lymphocyte attenuator [Esox lucius]|uniref:B- and T-lymphocyte attenuator n=1 Tax=Esox lucius TaxID=8010 RepID=UPI00147758A7|nr:B- and T-lymphocyte attenuator [Esox lucius]
MGANYLWSLTGLFYFILVGLLLWGVHGQDNGSDCYPEIRVQRNTVWKASLGDYLEINCPVIICTNSSSILWKKMNGSDWIPVNRTALIEIKWLRSRNNGTSFLVFQRIDVKDSGLYQCTLVSAVSHSINVTVTEHVEDTTVVNQKNETNVTSGQKDSFLEGLWHYVYISAGIAVFVIMVITISMLLIRGCKGVCLSKQSKKEEQPENQYTAIPLTEPVSPRPKPRPHHSQSPRPHQHQVTLNPDYIYDNTPAKGPRRLHQNPVQDAANQVFVPVDSDCTYDNMVVKEEESGIMYAALNHQVKPRTTPRSKQPQEECSEYAAIRVS